MSAVAAGGREPLHFALRQVEYVDDRARDPKQLPQALDYRPCDLLRRFRGDHGLVDRMQDSQALAVRDEHRLRLIELAGGLQPGAAPGARDREQGAAHREADQQDDCEVPTRLASEKPHVGGNEERQRQHQGEDDVRCPPADEPGSKDFQSRGLSHE